MHQPFHWDISLSFLLPLQFYQRCLEDQVATLHRYYHWLIYKDEQSPYVRSGFESSKCLRFLEFRCGQCKKEGFECKSSLPLDTGRFLAST